MAILSPARLLRRLAVACPLLVMSVSAPSVAAQQLAPFKDALFAYPALIDERADGAFRAYAYDEARDIDARDQVPERRVQRRYVDLAVNRTETAGEIAYATGSADYFQFGPVGRSAFAVIFIHGRGGDRRLGADDWTFGGNFNRLKNLVVRNRGVYYVPSLPDFDAGGRLVVSELINHVATTAPGAPIVLACASMGSAMCWDAARSQTTAAFLDGIVVLGGTADRDYLTSPARRLAVPIVIAHGSQDSVYRWSDQRQFFAAIKETAPSHPARFILFETGSHGTPIRMIDWRDTLNWIFSR